LAVRVAVNTGEAMVAFGEGPQVGEAVAGDVVNTASRMQGLAPHGSVVIGESTLRAVRGLFDVEALPPATVKGKAEPLQVWRVLGERTNPVVAEAPAFVGRRHELRLLGQLFDRVVESSTGHLVTVVGDPGMGKTRLMDEVRAATEVRARWLTGRCLPYGESVTFAPAADVVREVAGCAAADDPDRIRDALGSLASALQQDDEDGRRLQSVLETIVGAPTGGDAGATGMIAAIEVADAWARVIASVAGSGPVALRLEDLHWADEVLLDVIERVADAMAGRAVLIVCAARPELLERNPRWGAGRVNTTSVGLAPLSRQETEELLSGPIARPRISDSMREALLERSGGNPLYALEFVRMAGERVEVSLAGGMPETVQAVIAARLDGIPEGPRRVVQDAAVVGAEFWPGALVALSGMTEDAVREGVADLAHRGLVLRTADSSIAGQPQFAFGHALIREVAYARLTRAQRAAGHLAAARWLEGSARDVVEERTDWLARHYAEAAELGLVSEAADIVRDAREPAVTWLLAAGDLAGRLDAGRAFSLYQRAVNIAEAGSRWKAKAMAHLALTGRRSGLLDSPTVMHGFEDALAIMRRVGEPGEVADTMIRISSQAAAMGDSKRSAEVLEEAVHILEEAPPGPVLARAYAYKAEKEMFAGHVANALEFADRALAMAREWGRDDVVIMALHIRGDSLCSSGDPRGLDDLREALVLSKEVGSGSDVVTSNDYLAEWMSAIEGPKAAIGQYEEGIAMADRRGVVAQGQWTRAGSLASLFELGRWDDVERRCREVLESPPGLLDATVESASRTMLARVAVHRGTRLSEAEVDAILGVARPIDELQALSPALVVGALAACVRGEAALAGRFLEEFTEVTRDAAMEWRMSQLAEIVRLAIWAGRGDLVAELRAGADDRATLRGALNDLSARAAIAEEGGQTAAAGALFDEAARRWGDYANPLEEAYALLGRARCATGAAPAADDRARAGELLASLRAVAIPDQ
jgi:tetratricopeptide (TPR) repeat protein